MALLREHHGPLAADLRRFYGCSLADVLAGRVAGALEVADWVANLPPESAVFRASNPDGSWQHTHELELLRSVEHSLRWLVWAQTVDGGKNRNIPEPHRFPWEPVPQVAGSIRGDVMTLDEAAEWLGWAV